MLQRATCALLLALAAVASAANTASPYWGEYNTTAGPVPGKINVHMVPHTHDDTGWLVTVDQYYQSEVSFILDTILVRLLENPDRKFIYVETGFFERWWIQQTASKQADMKKVVASGQLEFINGGWCMHDEAAPHYVEMVENTARGHQFLLKTFGVKPKGTWQIDPFGHTNTQAWLIGQYAGLQFLYFGRMDNQDFAMRKNLSALVAPDVPKSIEWVWQGSKTFGKQYQTFTGELYGSGGGGYGAPSGLDFDGNGEQVQDDPRFHDYNLDAFVESFVKAAQDQAAHVRTDHVMWALGSDFNYQNAQHWYRNLDKLIHHINKNGTVNAFYSTPSIYTEAKHAEGLTWEARFDDVMPLADNFHHYWTGYFTSRQGLKKYLRVLSNYLQSARQLALLAPSAPCMTSGNTEALCTDQLEAAIAVTTHHDGLSGTEKQAVSDDYEQRMSDGHSDALGMVDKILAKMVGVDRVEQCHGERGLNISFCTTTTEADEFTVIAYNPQGWATSHVLRLPVSAGTYTVTDADGKTVASQQVALTERDRELPLLYLQFPELHNASRVAAFTNKAAGVLAFAAAVPAVGYSTFTVKKAGSAPSARSPAAPSRAAAPVTISNEAYEVTFDPAAGAVAHVKNLKSGVTGTVAIDIGFYNASVGGCTPGVGSTAAQQALREAPASGLGARVRREDGERGMDETAMHVLDAAATDAEAQKFACDGQKSGAYIFRPNSSTVFPAACAGAEGSNASAATCREQPTMKVVKGDVVSEVHITWAAWATAVVRLSAGYSAVEVEYTVGPIPQYSFEDAKRVYLQGKEVVLRYNTSLNSGGTFYADSNGREMVKREYNKRGPAYPDPYNISEPVAGNYYPVNALLALEDTAADVGFSVAVDRSMGGASVANGELELMVHRRTQADDSRGVGQPMNETMCGCRDQDPNNIGQCPCAGLTIRGSNFLVLDKIADAHATARRVSEEVNFAPLVAFTKETPTAQKSFTAVSADLPENVKLMTLGTTSPQCVPLPSARGSAAAPFGPHRASVAFVHAWRRLSSPPSQCRPRIHAQPSPPSIAPAGTTTRCTCAWRTSLRPASTPPSPRRPTWT